MFDWNLNSEAQLHEKKLLSNGMNQEGKKLSPTLSWKDYNDKLGRIKYQVKHETRKYKRNLVDKRIREFKEELKTSKDSNDPEAPDLEYKIKCEDFWLKRDDPRRDQLFRKMHPLIFLKEEVLDNYVKVQNNWVFQFLSEQSKKDYLQCRKPQHMKASS